MVLIYITVGAYMNAKSSIDYYIIFFSLGSFDSSLYLFFLYLTIHSPVEFQAKLTIPF